MQTKPDQIRPLRVSDAIALKENDIVGLRFFGDILKARVVSDVVPRMGRTVRGQFVRWQYHIAIEYRDPRSRRVVYAHVSESIMKGSLVMP